MSCLLAICIAFRQSGVYAAYTSHVHPYFVLGKTSDKDSTRYRKIQSVFACLDELVTKTYSNEMAINELFFRHSVHIIDLRMIYDGVAQLLNLYTSHVEHERWRLHASVLVTLVANDTCTVCNIRITCTVNDCLRKNSLTAGLGLYDHSLHDTILDDCVNDEGIKKNVYSTLFHNLECKVLHFLAVDHSEAGMEVTRLVSACSTSFCKSVNEFLRIALDDVISFWTKECKDRKTDCKVTSKVASAFNKHHLLLSV